MPRYDVARLDQFNELLGNHPLAEAGDAWQGWLAQRGTTLSPATVARWRAILQAALHHGAKAKGTTAPVLPTVRQSDEERVRFLMPDERDRLLAAYSPNARPVMHVLAWQGLRSQEALRMDWRHVLWAPRAIFIPETKTGRARTLAMHRQVRVRLYLIWRAAGRPSAGTVFLNRWGDPYSDTRLTGGNPLTKAHATACRTAHIADFTPHDWRHHWASWIVMTGGDLVTLQRMGGWKKLTTVQRYAAVSTDHMADAIARLR